MELFYRDNLNALSAERLNILNEVKKPEFITKVWV